MALIDIELCFLCPLLFDQEPFYLIRGQPFRVVWEGLALQKHGASLTQACWVNNLYRFTMS